MVKQIVITAGGTSEPIDGVRRITNVSTGSLGWCCLEAVLERFSEQLPVDFHLHYIHTESALLRPVDAKWKSRISFVPVTDARSVYDTVNQLTQTIDVDYFIHAMAISDFTFAWSAPLHSLANELADAYADGGNQPKAALINVLEKPHSSHRADQKLKSDMPVVMGLKPTQKVISLIKQNNPRTVLVGFKLLKGVDDEELLRVACRLAERNGCNLVFANEVSAIDGENHRGMLIKDGACIARPVGKVAIAQAIVENMLACR